MLNDFKRMLWRLFNVPSIWEGVRLNITNKPVASQHPSKGKDDMCKKCEEYKETIRTLIDIARGLCGEIILLQQPRHIPIENRLAKIIELEEKTKEK